MLRVTMKLLGRHLVVPIHLVMLSALNVVMRVDWGDEIARDDPGALVDQLIEGMLTIRA